jgi:hypothetical protein
MAALAGAGAAGRRHAEIAAGIRVPAGDQHGVSDGDGAQAEIDDLSDGERSPHAVV